ncbi:copper transporter [Pengzhenrongella frigida]|uniref:Copper transporter n=1 Tax=Pengzhenrongella frigida TaxID=1259133 RepID=A0A4V1ZH25_9MICO|nr:copper transporter [Cellulomonas sp. HLT2-17]RYV50564.1 copper transporter [Cellulomonas sp. HLT2-17]
MIDFRYHIVSLISVFLALAVGIALGAGPLKETIGDSLTGQVEQLRQDRDALRSDLDATEQTQADQKAYLEAAAPRLLSGALTDRRVAIVTIGAVDDDSVAAVTSQLDSAGATVSAQVEVTDSWTDPSLRSFRQALAGNLVTYLEPAPAESAGPDVELAEALIQGLTGADPASPNELSESASLILELLANDESKLITVAEPVSTPADAVVILTSSDPEETATAEGSQDVVAAEVAIASAAQARSEGAVVATVRSSEGDLVSTILADGDLAQELTTVTGVDQITGQISIPLALNARIGTVVGHYGFGDGETVMPERVTVTAVDRTPAVVPVDPASDVQATG